MEILAAGMRLELSANGHTTDNGDPRRLLTEYRLLRQAQLQFQQTLGMSPQARMAMKVGDSRSRAYDLAALGARGGRG
jgi:hypothetical protein